jgi:hypothetical protein
MSVNDHDVLTDSSSGPIRVVLTSTALLPFLSVRKAAALSIAELGVAAFFIAGTTQTALGESAPWFVLAATILAAFLRAIDIELGCPYQQRRSCWNHCSLRPNLSSLLARWQSSDLSWRRFEIALLRARSCSSRSSHCGISSRSLNDRTPVAFG